MCSILFKSHILTKFNFETLTVAKHEDTALSEDCIPQKMRFRDKELPELDIRVDVRMFKCPVRFKKKDPDPLLPGDAVVRDFFITKGNANQTVTLLLTSNDKTQKPNICLEDIFWYNDTNIIDYRFK